MLRRRLSAGALRAAAQRSQLHSQSNSQVAGITAAAGKAKATIKPQNPAQSKSLASAVLLGTQRSWKEETVVTLKAELKRRGLSQQGNKATLINRLSSAETSSFLPPVPPLPAKTKRSRSVSTSAAAQAPSEPQPPTKDTPEHIVANAPVVEAPAPLSKEQDLTPDQKTTAPGLPIRQKSPTAHGVKFPERKPDPKPHQTIPTLPHVFKGSSHEPAPKLGRDATEEPKVMTVTMPSTHADGGPVHQAEAVVNPFDIETKAEQKDAASSSSNPKAEAEAVADATTATDAAIAAAVSSLPKMPPAPKAGEGDYKASSRPLDDNERRGAWWLAGALATVVFLTGLGRSETVRGKAKKEVDAAVAEARAEADRMGERAVAAKDAVVQQASDTKDQVVGTVVGAGGQLTTFVADAKDQAEGKAIAAREQANRAREKAAAVKDQAVDKAYAAKDAAVEKAVEAKDAAVQKAYDATEAVKKSVSGK